MCGIAGIAGFEDRALLKKMCATLARRGPDDSGFFFDRDIGLGHRRLSIIDLEGGHQPMSNEDGTVWVVFNGEIFNFREVRAVLEKRGHRFRTGSDTEVLVHAYEEYGTGFVAKLRGMFAFAIWDSGKGRLMLARDRLGINPLYYHVSGGSVLFASELKAILQSREIQRKVSLPALNDYLTFQAAVGPKTLFEGIFELLPGHMLLWSGGTYKIREYWDVPAFKPLKVGEEEAVDLLIREMEDAVRCHLVSDVPVGMYLSGGIDSNIVLALMHRNYADRINTFSMGFGYPETDEFEYAGESAQKFGTNHREVIIEEKKVLRDMGRIIRLLEDPIADFGEFANFYISKELNRRGVKVTLSGGGSDELFAGYPGHLRTKRLHSLKKRTPAFLHKGLPKVAALLPRSVPKNLGINTFAEELARDYYGTNGALFPTEYEKKMLYSKEAYSISRLRDGAERIEKCFSNHRIPRGQLLTRAQYVDLKVYVDAHMLHADKMNLAHSVEVRYPLLDYKFVEFAFTLPQELRVRDSVEKYIVRSAARKVGVPKAILSRKKKGFSGPIERWLAGETGEFAKEALDGSELIRKLFRSDYISSIASKVNDHWYAHKLWGLMVLALWHREYFEKGR